MLIGDSLGGEAVGLFKESSGDTKTFAGLGVFIDLAAVLLSEGEEPCLVIIEALIELLGATTGDEKDDVEGEDTALLIGVEDESSCVDTDFLLAPI